MKKQNAMIVAVPMKNRVSPQLCCVCRKRTEFFNDRAGSEPIFKASILCGYVSPLEMLVSGEFGSAEP